MYGLIGKIRTQPGQRDALIAILVAGTGSMPGCLSYVVAKDPADADGIWITEVWDSQESQRHRWRCPRSRRRLAGDDR
jgi:quinol monooxygenase YgiN